MKPLLSSASFVEQQNFRVSTIESYLAALKQPLSLAFGIDFEDVKFKHLMKSFWLKRPGARYVEPKWKLEPCFRVARVESLYLSLCQSTGSFSKVYVFAGFGNGTKGE